MFSALSVVASLSINTGILIFILPYLNFTSSPTLLTVDVSAHQMVGRNIVLCFTISLTCTFSVFSTGVLIIIPVSLFISYKIFNVFGSCPKLYILIDRSSFLFLSRHLWSEPLMNQLNYDQWMNKWKIYSSIK